MDAAVPDRFDRIGDLEEAAHGPLRIGETGVLRRISSGGANEPQPLSFL